MPNIAAILKEEIRRLAKKEIKANASTTKQAVARYRRAIAQLKRQVQKQGKDIARLEAQGLKGESSPIEEPQENLRFSARSVRAQRKRLKLSAEDYAKLVGVSSLTIYHWEHGKSRPRQAQFEALVAIRGIGKREAMAKLETLQAEEAKQKGRRKA